MADEQGLPGCTGMMAVDLEGRRVKYLDIVQFANIKE